MADRSTPVRAAFAYALGGAPPESVTSADLPLWTAASRARAPLADDPALLAIGQHFDMGGLGRAPASRVLIFPNRRYQRFVLEPNASGELPGLFPTLDLSAAPKVGWSRLAPDVAFSWLSTIWPGNTEPLLADVLCFQVCAPAGMTDRGGRRGLDLLSRTVSELPPMAKYVLAAGLGMPTLADREHAVDVDTH